MQSGVFLLKDDKDLTSLQPAQFATEADFQALLARFPELLVGDQIDPECPRRWVLVRREQAIATGEAGGPQWSIDHLFLDQDGVPTLVEVKRQGDSRIRREVVGQMLDYAANCMTYWSIDSLKDSYERTCKDSGRNGDDMLAELIGPEQTSAQFWTQVKTNLQAGRLRLLFVADHIPIELRRIVEFLNQQMDPVEVLAIELRQYAKDGLKTIVPMVYGQTQEATQRRSRGTSERWDEQRFFDKLQTRVGSTETAIARKVYEWMGKAGRRLVFGTGREEGSAYPLLRPQGVVINPVYLSTDGKIWLQFRSLEGKPIFGEIGKRRELMRKFSEIRGSGLSEADLGKYPSIPLAKIAADPEGASKLLAALEWMDAQLNANTTEEPQRTMPT